MGKKQQCFWKKSVRGNEESTGPGQAGARGRKKVATEAELDLKGR